MEHFTRSLEETPVELTDIFQSIQNMEQPSIANYDKVGLYRESESMRMVKIGEYNSNRGLMETEMVLIYYPEERAFSGGLNYSRLDLERYDGKIVEIPEKLYNSSRELLDEMH